MGFNVGANRARLEFGEGSLLDGATVRVSLNAKLRLLFSLQQALPALGDLTNVSAEDAERGDELCEDFIDSGSLLSWDLEREDDDGAMAPIPTDRAGFMSLLLAQRIAIITAWVQALSEATGPSPKPSAASASTAPISIDGARSEAGFEQMVPA